MSASGSPKSELEQVRRDKSIATGLINTMQKDLSTKVPFILLFIFLINSNKFVEQDATISKLAREIEGLKKEISDKDATICDLNERLGALKDFKKADEERQNKEKELLVLKNVI